MQVDYFRHKVIPKWVFVGNDWLYDESFVVTTEVRAHNVCCVPVPTLLKWKIVIANGCQPWIVHKLPDPEYGRLPLPSSDEDKAAVLLYTLTLR